MLRPSTQSALVEIKSVSDPELTILQVSFLVIFTIDAEFKDPRHVEKFMALLKQQIHQNSFTFKENNLIASDTAQLPSEPTASANITLPTP